MSAHTSVCCEIRSKTHCDIGKTAEKSVSFTHEQSQDPVASATESHRTATTELTQTARWFRMARFGSSVVDAAGLRDSAAMASRDPKPKHEFRTCQHP